MGIFMKTRKNGVHHSNNTEQAYVLDKLTSGKISWAWVDIWEDDAFRNCEFYCCIRSEP